MVPASANWAGPKRPPRFSPTCSQTYAPSEKAFVAGLAAARQLRALQRTDDAEAIYAALIEKYPKRNDLDKLLNEWAVMHHAAKNYDRSDAIYRRIVAEHPDSPLADDARLNLAISDLIAGKTTEARQKFQQLESDKKRPRKRFAKRRCIV